MRALIYKDQQIQFESEHPIPRSLKDEALIRVTHAGICSTDLEICKGYMGFEGVPGHEFVGIVEECNEKQLIGKRVVGEINIGCKKCSCCEKGLANHCPNRSVLGILNKDGVFAEYITLPVNNLHLIPDSVTDEAAVFVEPLAAAFEIIEQVQIAPNEKVCLIGDGRLALLAAQVLKLTGCDLIVAGKHDDKLAMLKGLGIKTTLSRDLNDRVFDIVVDCTGSSSGLEKAVQIVRSRGTIVLKTTIAGNREFDFNQLVIDEITLIGSRCGPFKPAIEALQNYTVDVEPLISKAFDLEDGVEAFRYAGQNGVLKVILKI